MKHKKTLIIQGGGFRTGYSTGVLDAFLTHGYQDFDFFIGNSGGAIALSYFLSGQYRSCFEAICLLASDKEFMSYNRFISPTGMMNVDYFHEVARQLVPFDVTKAMDFTEQRKLAFILTDLETGQAHYYHPNDKTWVDAIIASCTLPFVTKGRHQIHGREYMDGGWSDPLPVEWAYENGARDILVIRTSPKDLKASQSWSDYFGAMVHRSNDALKTCFEHNHEKYNNSIDFINNPPHDLSIQQISPLDPLRAGTYTNSIPALTEDYRRGLHDGLDFIMRERGILPPQIG